jgi:hypothetical protein
MKNIIIIAETAQQELEAIKNLKKTKGIKVEVVENVEKPKTKEKPNILSLAGIWKGRTDIDSKTWREKSWRKNH